MNLNVFNTDNLFVAATNLFQQLNIKLNSNTAEPLPIVDILKNHYKDNHTFNAIYKTYFIGIIDDNVFQKTLFENKYDYPQAIEQGDKNYNGLMLFALELNKQPTRAEISELTRAFNRTSQKMPVALVLKYPSTYLLDAKEALISIALSERFKYLQNWRQGEKAGKVIILRDIHTQSPHAGHTRILQDLVKPAGVSTYEQLHQRWLQVLDVNILNKKFFQEISNWYFAAMSEVSFPDDLEKKNEVRNATNLIRLITRVIFIWFIKEKHLVPASLFRKDFVAGVLRDFNQNKKSHNYYNAILQNLFFGTLNQKMGERKFAKEGNIQINKEEYGVKNLYRYANLFSIHEEEILKLFDVVPFLNGGLFDCLDKPNDAGNIQYVDGFSRNAKKRAIVPDHIFFGEEKEVDLNDVYGTKNKRYNSRGLINLLESYKFTVAENTPIEEEIALDPELLGKVFENLLASYNPETQTTARKQTGSFYTPREIVNYMVEESLLEYLKSSPPDKGEYPKGEGVLNNFLYPKGEGVLNNFLYPKGEGVKIFNKLEFKTFRRELRNNLTPAEAKLWTLLQGKQLDGRKFRRQHSVDKYVLDFYCPEEKLALELDGEGHFTATGIEYDLERDAFISQFGIKVLRFENRWVWDNPEGLLEEIKSNFGWSKQPPRPADTPPLQGGVLFEHRPADTPPLQGGELFEHRPADTPPLQGGELLETRLRDVFSYSENPNPFNEVETKLLIEAINKCKILDPACGSGAFPMGILHKMVHILKKLDPENKFWKDLQRKKAIEETEAAFNIGNKEQRAIRLSEINDVFENNASDYGRKLYLIENCIYGIDIQPIAVQIAKLRFFISLVCDQQTQKAPFLLEEGSPKDGEVKNNFGIRPLPNLETKFVAANTLIGLEIPTNDLFAADNPIKNLENELKEVRHKYFTASTRTEKLRLQAQDKALRRKISIEVNKTLTDKKETEIKSLAQQITDASQKLGEIENEPEQKITYTNTNLFGETETTVVDKKKEKIKSQKNHIALLQKQLTILQSAESNDGIERVAEQISSFDPYDQNQFANWFEPEWMFGIVPPTSLSEVTTQGGFDIVIGNPPYVQMQKDGGKLAREFETNGYQTFERTGDIYTLFYEKGIQLLKHKGHLTYITSNKWMRAGYGKSTRAYLAKHNPVKLLDLGSGIFESATVDTNILVIQKHENLQSCMAADLSKLKNSGQLNHVHYIALSNLTDSSWTIANATAQSIKEKIERAGKPLKDWDIQINYGIKTGYNEAFIIDGKTKDALIAQDSKSAEIIKPILRGRDIKRYKAEFADLWLIATFPALKLNIDTYPAVKAYLKSFGKKMNQTGEEFFDENDQKQKSRKKTGNKWFETQDQIGYHQEFEREKIIYPNMTLFLPFIFDDKRHLINDKGFILTSNNVSLKFLLGYFNSKMAQRWIRENCPELQGGTRELRKVFFENIPIPPLSTPDQQPFVVLVDKILAGKENGQDTTAFEDEIDRLVYPLFGLTGEEIKAVEHNIY